MPAPTPTTFLQLHLEPDEPIAVQELVGSLSALARQYQLYVAGEGGGEKSSQAKLLVSSVSPGSIDISLIPEIIDVASASAIALAPWMDKATAVAGFARKVHGLLSKFKSPKGDDKSLVPSTMEEVTLRDCDDAQAIFKPVAEHGGTQTFNSYADGAVVYNFNVSSPEAVACIENVIKQRALLRFPEGERYANMPLIWARIDDGEARKSGSTPDKAVIEPIDPKKKPIFFADGSTTLKNKMVRDEAYPLDRIYFVDVLVTRVGGRVVSYTVIDYHGSDEIENGARSTDDDGPAE